MRGRTNISGGGIAINGTLVNATVGDGQIINAGDFVEYKTQTTYETIDEQGQAICYVVDLPNDYKIMACLDSDATVSYNKRSTSLKLYKFSQGSIILKHSILENVFGMCKKDDTSIYTIIYDSGTFKVCTYAIEEDRLVKGDKTVSLNSLSGISYYYLIDTGYELIALSSYFSSSKRSNYAIKINYDLSTPVNNLSYSPKCGDMNSYFMLNVFNIGRRIFIFETSYKTSYIYCFYPIDISDSSVTVGSNIKTGSYTFDYSGLFGDTLVSRNTESKNKYSLVIPALLRNNLLLIDNDNLNFTEISVSNLYPTDDSSNGYCCGAVTKFDYNKNVVYIALFMNRTRVTSTGGSYVNDIRWIQFFVLNFNSNTGDYSIASNYKVLELMPKNNNKAGNAWHLNYNSEFFVNGDKIAFLMTPTESSSSKAINGKQYAYYMNYKNGNLTDAVSGNVVTQWTGSGNPTALSKDDGVGGDSIGIYIPETN